MSTATSGYPQMSVGGKKAAMHRWSYEHFRGPIPDGMYVCHRCDVKRCVNPTHLEIGDARKNTADAIDRGLYVPANVAKTHCVRGHELPDKGHDGKRQCRECQRIHKSTPEYNARRREKRRMANPYRGDNR